MFIKNLWDKILALFDRKTSTSDKEYTDNQNYSMEYQDIKDINFNAIFANTLSNYSANESNIVIDENNARAKYINEKAQEVWADRKKIFNRMLGTGGVFVIPYYAKGELQYNLIPQFRVSINEMIGKKIVNMTVLADILVQKSGFTSKMYYRWTDYRIENNNEYITQRYTDENGSIINKPELWQDIVDSFVIPNVEKITCGYFKSPIDNRQSIDNYGVPITYGCEKTIREIKECLEQIKREFKLKEAFVGADSTMFNGNNALPTDGLYRKIDSGDDEFWEVFDPAIRESSYYARLQELYARLEKEIGTSKGILTEVETKDATATAIRKALYDTFNIVTDARIAFEKGMNDLIEAMNVIANYYSITPIGEYEVNYDWSYDLLDSTEESFSQLMAGLNQGIIKKEEMRQWLKPDETLEESRKAVEEIQANEPDIKDLLGTKE